MKNYKFKDELSFFQKIQLFLFGKIEGIDVIKKPSFDELGITTDYINVIVQTITNSLPANKIASAIFLNGKKTHEDLHKVLCDEFGQSKYYSSNFLNDILEELVRKQIIYFDGKYYFLHDVPKMVLKDLAKK